MVALNAQTGRRVWHFQMTHHDIWDYDPPCAPILADITVAGRPIKAVVQLTKQGTVFVLDRTNGRPVWPIEERPVPKSDVPGEWTSPTQPFPTKPAAIEVQGVTENDLVDFTPEIKTEALRVARQFRLGGLYAPPSLPNAADGTAGTLTAPSAGGGVNWPGGAIDPVDDVLYVASQTTLFRAQLSEGSPKTGVLYHDTRGQTIGPSTTVFGLPLIKPPYGRVTAVDLKTGERLWMVPHGNTPDAIKRNPKLQGVEIPNTGAQTRGTGSSGHQHAALWRRGWLHAGAPRLGQEDRRRRRGDPVTGSDDRISGHVYEGRASVHRRGGAGWRCRRDRGVVPRGCALTSRPRTTVQILAAATASPGRQLRSGTRKRASRSVFM